MFSLPLSIMCIQYQAGAVGGRAGNLMEWSVNNAYKIKGTFICTLLMVSLLLLHYIGYIRLVR